MVKIFSLILVALMTLFFAQQGLAADVSVWVNPAVVGPDQSFTLTLSSSIENDESPDLAPLEKNFQVLSQKSSSSISIVDGSTVIKKSWNIVLLPLKTGKLQIPSIKLGKSFSIPVSVEVREQSTIVEKSARHNQDIFIEVDAVPQNPYVQGQILLTQKLYHAVPIENASLSVPVAKGSSADIVKLSSKPAYNQFINDRRYQVIERRFALFPKHSGELLVEAAVFKGRIPDAEGGGSLLDLFSNSRAAKVNSKPLVIDVRPQDPSYSGEDWLPAKNITLYGNWSKPIDQLKVGEPVTLLLGIIADGLRSEQIPDIQFDVPENINVYPEAPEMSNNTANSGITGVWNQRITFIPSELGEFTIPAYKLAWWSVLDDQQKFAELTAYQLAVTEEGTFQPSQTPPIQGDVMTEISSDENGSFKWWLIVLLPFVVIGVYFAYQRWRTQCFSVKKPVNTREENKQKILSSLESACLSNNAKEVVRLLPQWAIEVAHISPPTLPAIAVAANSRHFKEEINVLSKALYAKSGTKWKGENLWNAINKFSYSKHKASEKSHGELVEMYPQS